MFLSTTRVRHRRRKLNRAGAFDACDPTQGETPYADPPGPGKTPHLSAIAADADRTYQLYLAGGLDVKQFKERYQPLDDRKKQLEADLPKVEAEVDALQINSLSGEEVASKAKDLPSRWKSMTPDERRQLVEIIVKEIVVGEKTFDVTLYELPIFKEVVNRQRTL